MNSALTFEVPGRPVGKGRPRVLRSGRTYTPKRTADYERQVAAACVAAAMHRPWRMDSPDYAVTVQSHVSLTKKGTRRTSRGGCPDIDNVIKLVCDALEGVVYEDDDQVTRVAGETIHGSAEERLRVTVEIIEKGEQ